MTAIVLSHAEKDTFKIVMAINQLTQGRSNAVGSVTLDANSDTTTVLAPNCAAGSHVFLFPQTASAATEFGAGTIRIAAATVTKGQFIITHVNSATTTRTFSWLAIG